MAATTFCRGIPPLPLPPSLSRSLVLWILLFQRRGLPVSNGNARSPAECESGMEYAARVFLPAPAVVGRLQFDSSVLPDDDSDWGYGIIFSACSVSRGEAMIHSSKFMHAQ